MSYIRDIFNTPNQDYLDPFARQRVSSAITLFDNKQLTSKNSFVWDEVLLGSATSIHTPSNASTAMAVSLSGDAVIRQTYSRFNYSPGKGMLFIGTGTMGATVANTDVKIGYFNSSFVSPYNTGYDGLYFHDNGTDLGVVIAKNGTETRTAQSSWNIDRLDGSGGEFNPSGLTLDLTKSQIFLIDFEWLGVGLVRFGFFIDGKPVYVHKERNANINSGVYMSSPNHSVRYEIRSTGGTRTLEHICCSVESEGGFEPKGNIFSYDSGADSTEAIEIDVTDYRPALGFRLQAGSEDIIVKLLDVNVLVETRSNFRWALFLNPTLTLNGDTFNYNPITEHIEIAKIGQEGNDVSATISGGDKITSNYMSDSINNSQLKVESVRTLGASIAGVRDEYVLAISNVGTGARQDYFASFNWQEQL